MNAKMPELARAFERGGFTDVKTVQSSGNVVFGARASSLARLEKKAEAAMQDALGRSFGAFVRPIDALAALLSEDRFTSLRLEPGAKRVVTFLREPPPAGLALPIEHDGASILEVEGLEVLSAYVPSPRGPAFMTLLERTFGKNITTRTWDTIARVAKVGGA